MHSDSLAEEETMCQSRSHTVWIMDTLTITQASTGNARLAAPHVYMHSSSVDRSRGILSSDRAGKNRDSHICLKVHESIQQFYAIGMIPSGVTCRRSRFQ